MMSAPTSARRHAAELVESGRAMKKRKEFVPGQLVWITSTATFSSDVGLPQTAKGYPTRIRLVPGTPCTIIRKALAKDFGIYARHTYRGRSTGAQLAVTSWLTLYNGAPMMIDEIYLVKRFYKPRQKA
jgi:hypothetical protein